MIKTNKLFIKIVFILCIFVTSFVFLNAKDVSAKTKKASVQVAPVIPKACYVPEEAMHNYIRLLISTITTPEMDQNQKLRACFDYELEHMKYKRDLNPGVGTSIEDYALEAFFSGEGNCYRYASMFAYMAKELGFNAHVEAGDCTSSKGGLTPHSWCVIDFPDGLSLIYDLSFADSNRKVNFYGIPADAHTRKLYPYERWELMY